MITDIYKKRIFDYYNELRFRGPPSWVYDFCFESRSDFCGDQATLWIKKETDQWFSVAVNVKGCILAVSAANMVVESVNQRGTEFFDSNNLDGFIQENLGTLPLDSRKDCFAFVFMALEERIGKTNRL